MKKVKWKDFLYFLFFTSPTARTAPSARPPAHTLLPPWVPTALPATIWNMEYGWGWKLTGSTGLPAEQQQHFPRWSNSRSLSPPCCKHPFSAPWPATHIPGSRCSGFPAWPRLLGSVCSFLGQCSHGWEGMGCGSLRSDQGQSLHLHLLLSGHGSEWNSGEAGNMLAWSWSPPSWLTWRDTYKSSKLVLDQYTLQQDSVLNTPLRVVLTLQITNFYPTKRPVCESQKTCFPAFSKGVS